MFTNKKILAALLCTPFFAACVVNGDDEAGDSGGTEPTSTTMSTTDPTATTSMSTTDATTDDTSASTTATTTADTGSESESGSSGGTTGDTDTGGGGMACFQSCEAAEDCLAGLEAICPDGIGDYPCNYTCEADGTCSNGGCGSDMDCENSGLAGWVCVDLGGGYMGCAAACETDQDCEDQFLMGWTCPNGMNCEAPPVPDCTSDEDCGGFGVCDLDTGDCGCATTDDCPKGTVCAGV